MYLIMILGHTILMGASYRRHIIVGRLVSRIETLRIVHHDEHVACLCLSGSPGTGWVCARWCAPVRAASFT